MTLLGKELKEGTFGAKTPEEITTEYLSILLLTKTPKEALSHLISSYQKHDESAITDDENHVYIGGIKIQKSTRS